MGGGSSTLGALTMILIYDSSFLGGVLWIESLMIVFYFSSKASFN